MIKHEALASAVTGIDDDLLQEAVLTPPAPRRPVFGRIGAMAAALLLVFGIAVLWQQSGAARLSVGGTAVGSTPVAVTQQGSSPRASEPALHLLQPLEISLTLTCRGEWQLSATVGELRVTQGDTTSEWSAAQSGSGSCTVLWVIEQPVADGSCRLTLNTQTVTLSQNGEGVWTIQKTS